MKSPAVIPALPQTIEPASEQGPIPREVVKQIAMDIGKAVAAHVEQMYPEAVKATSSTFLLSLRNSTYNEIMAALETTDEAAILARLERRKRDRRKLRSMWRNNRKERA